MLTTLDDDDGKSSDVYAGANELPSLNLSCLLITSLHLPIRCNLGLTLCTTENNPGRLFVLLFFTATQYQVTKSYFKYSAQRFGHKRPLIGSNLSNPVAISWEVLTPSQPPTHTHILGRIEFDLEIYIISVAAAQGRKIHAPLKSDLNVRSNTGNSREVVALNPLLLPDKLQQMSNNPPALPVPAAWAAGNYVRGGTSSFTLPPHQDNPLGGH
ncbi:hypothetical protein CBL_11220 [Carabus blaptoides fortunei]